MSGYWLGLTVGFFLGVYIGIFYMIILRIAKEEDKNRNREGIIYHKTTK